MTLHLNWRYLKAESVSFIILYIPKDLEQCSAHKRFSAKTCIDYRDEANGYFSVSLSLWAGRRGKRKPVCPPTLPMRYRFQSKFLTAPGPLCCVTRETHDYWVSVNTVPPDLYIWAQYFLGFFQKLRVENCNNSVLEDKTKTCFIGLTVYFKGSEMHCFMNILGLNYRWKQNEEELLYPEFQNGKRQVRRWDGQITKDFKVNVHVTKGQWFNTRRKIVLGIFVT